jgi:hypothetical protein
MSSFATCPGSASIKTYIPMTLQQPANILTTWSELMMIQIAPMLAVCAGNPAIDLYKAALGAQFLRHPRGSGDVAAPDQL